MENRPKKRKYRMYKKLHKQNRCPHCKAKKSGVSKNCYGYECYEYECSNCGCWLHSFSYGHIESWFYLLDAYRGYKKWVKRNPNSKLAKDGFPL
jgi:transcription elongation factor Elf1